MVLVDHPLAGRLIYHVVSGDVFYTAMALLSVAAGMRIAGSWRPMYRWRRVARAAAVLGAVAVVISLGSLTLWWLVYLFALGTGASLNRHARRGRMLCAVLGIGLGALAAADAWRYERGLGPRGKAYPGVVALGDSLSSGVEGAAEPWPQRMGERIGWPVVNLSVPGATLGAGAELVGRREVRASLVIVALGGNDVVGRTPRVAHAEALDGLLGQLVADDNDVVLLEVPAPPEAPWYGWSQRQMAARHGVRLVPRRVWAEALLIADGGETERDGAGPVLSEDGHERLARRMVVHLRRWFADPRDAH